MGARYKKGGSYAADMARYALMLSEKNTNEEELDQLKKALWRALREDITRKQRDYMLMYYADGLSMGQIAAKMEVDKSTVSRTIRRGEENLRRCLRYGAKRLLMLELEES